MAANANEAEHQRPSGSSLRVTTVKTRRLGLIAVSAEFSGVTPLAIMISDSLIDV